LGICGEQNDSEADFSECLFSPTRHHSVTALCALGAGTVDPLEATLPKDSCLTTHEQLKCIVGFHLFVVL
jgi:hypothetical protein